VIIYRLAPSGTLGPASVNVLHNAVKDSGPEKGNATVACLESPGAPGTTSNLLSATMRYLNIYIWVFTAKYKIYFIWYLNIYSWFLMQNQNIFYIIMFRGKFKVIF